MPSARVNTAITVNPGCLMSIRKPKRRSRNIVLPLSVAGFHLDVATIEELASRILSDETLPALIRWEKIRRKSDGYTQEFVLEIGRMKFVQFRTVWPAVVVLLASSFPDVPRALRQADLVFSGKLVRVEYLDPPQSVRHTAKLVYPLVARIQANR